VENTDSLKLTEQQQRYLQEEAFIAEVLMRRGSQGAKSPGWWRQLLTTPGGAALITVLVGGILAAVINWQIQINLKERETQQSFEKTKGEIALLSYKSFLEKRDEIIGQTFDLIGSCVTAAEDLVGTMGPDFDLRKFTGKEQQLIKERESIATRFNTAENDWSSKRMGIGRLLSHYHQGKAEVGNNWGSLEQSVSQLLQCAGRNLSEFRQDYLPRETATVCRQEKEAVAQQENVFNEALEKARTYLWNDLVVPRPLPKPAR
jgi:hypothetical protein